MGRLQRDREGTHPLPLPRGDGSAAARILAALAVNLTLEFAQILIDANNAFAAAVGQVGLPGYGQAGVEQGGMALVFVAITYISGGLAKGVPSRTLLLYPNCVPVLLGVHELRLCQV